MSHRPSDCRGPSLKVGTALLAVLLCAAGVRAETAKVHSPTVESVRLLIEESIRLGVPLYNSGQQEACAAVYRTALRSLQLLAGVSVDGPRLERVLRTAEGQEPDRSDAGEGESAERGADRRQGATLRGWETGEMLVDGRVSSRSHRSRRPRRGVVGRPPWRTGVRTRLTPPR